MRKDNVRFAGIKPETVVALWIVENVYKSAGEVFVITSVVDGKHGQVSYHKAGYAFDCRLPTFALGKVVNELRRILRPEYDVVVETDHLHIEFDVRRQGGFS